MTVASLVSSRAAISTADRNTTSSRCCAKNDATRSSAGDRSGRAAAMRSSRPAWPVVVTFTASSGVLLIDPHVVQGLRVESVRTHPQTAHPSRARLDTELGEDRDDRRKIHEPALRVLVGPAPFGASGRLFRPGVEQRVGRGSARFEKLVLRTAAPP